MEINRGYDSFIKFSAPKFRKSQPRPEVPSEVLIIFPSRLQEVCHWIDFVVRLEIQVAHWNWNISLITYRNGIFFWSNNIIKQFKNKTKKNIVQWIPGLCLGAEDISCFKFQSYYDPVSGSLPKKFSFKNIANSELLTILENSVKSWNIFYLKVIF